MPTVSSGGTLNVSSGHTSTGVIVNSGGTLDVLSGGKIITTTDRGFVEVFGGGHASVTYPAAVRRPLTPAGQASRPRFATAAWS
jgi:autotransporter passenger strand-loop-strand repeat protein